MKSIVERLITTTLVWFWFLHLIYAVSARISNVRLLKHHHSTERTGFVQVLHNGIWKSVCSQGNEPNDRSWGTPEASAVCRQLGYHGGWMWESSHEASSVVVLLPLAVDDFRCRGDEISLETCYYDRYRRYGKGRSGCGRNNLAGARCFASYEVRLVGGTTPNAGRVQVRYNNEEWTSICYDTRSYKGHASRDWGFNEVQVVCRELGYPGALMKHRGGYGDGEGLAYNDGFHCIGSEASLKQCLSNTPVHVSTHQRYVCGPRNEAVAICAEPGYVGCYTYSRHFPLNALYDRLESQRMTLHMCKTHCHHKEQHQYAALYEGHVCYCGTKDFILSAERRLSDTKCRDPCGGNDHEICGGYNTLSVYDVEIGKCLDPFNKTISYDFGDIVEDINCDTGYDVHGESTVQCIMGDSSNDTKWSGRFPQCREQNAEQQRKASSYTNALIALWVSIGLVSVFIITTVTMVTMAECTIRRRCQRASKLLPACTLPTRLYNTQQGKMAPSEPLYETTILDSESLCSMKKQEQTTIASKYEQIRNLKWTRGKSRYHDKDDQRRALFRHSDDDVVGYIIRTKL